MAVSIVNIDGSTWSSAVCPNSCRILYAANDTLLQLMNKFEEYITSTTTYGVRGWTLHDTLMPATTAVVCTNSQLASFTLTGSSSTNSDYTTGYPIWYVSATNATTTRTVNVYKDSARTQLVASGTRTGDGAITLSQQNTSGLSGAVTITYTADNTIATAYFPYRVYKAPTVPDINAAVSYMYIRLNYATSGSIACEVFESWNATTHALTNRADNSDVVTYQPKISTHAAGTLAAAGSIYIACSYPATGGLITYLYFQGGLYSSGCFQTERANSADDTVIAGYPVQMYFGVYGAIDLTFTTTPSCSKPRSRNNDTGISAGTNKCFINTIFGFAVAGFTALATTSTIMAAALTQANKWTNKSLVSDITFGYAIANTIFIVDGRMMGPKLGVVGYLMDEISININSATSFVDPVGTAVTHIIFMTLYGRLALPK